MADLRSRGSTSLWRALWCFAGRLRFPSRPDGNACIALFEDRADLIRVDADVDAIERIAAGPIGREEGRTLRPPARVLLRACARADRRGRTLVESFGGRVRDELLAAELLSCLTRARALIEDGGRTTSHFLQNMHICR